MKRLIAFFKDEEGATMVEYGIMVAVVAVIVMAGAKILGTQTSGTFSAVGGAMPQTVPQ